jgi:tetratricopeptide (TPR) repeat protein
MTRLFRTPLLAALVAAPLAAQQGAATCNIDFNQPKEMVALYNISRPRVIQMPAGEDRGKLMKDMFKTLSNPKVAAANPVGSNMIKGELLILWLMQPNQGPTATNAQLNLGEPKDAVVDLAKMADSLFTGIETAQPACKGDIKVWREAKPWQDRINAAFKALSEQKYDQAEELAKQSLVLDRTSPYADRVMAGVAQGRKQNGEMLKYLASALALSEGDTIYAEDRRAVQFQIGQVGLEYAETQPEPTRTQVLRQAADAMIALATESPSADATPYALSGIGMAATSLKDTVLFSKCFKMVDGALDKYNDLSTLQAAVCANRANKPGDAVRLFQATIAKNPNARDALYNAAALMYDQRKGAEMLPLVKKLVELDPSNPDNVSLFAYAYNVLNEQAKDPKVKKALVDTVAMYMKQSDDMPHRLQMVEFNRYADKATLEGEIENRGKAARGYTVELEFLDVTGAVVDKQTATVASVEPGKRGTFALTVAKPKVVAWRYAAIK